MMKDLGPIAYILPVGAALLAGYTFTKALIASLPVLAALAAAAAAVHYLTK